MINFLLLTTILIIGDSHSVGPFGWTLDENFRRVGHSVATYASCGSTADWWRTGKKTTCGFYSRDIDGHEIRLTSNRTPKLNDLLQTIRPELVIIELGSNYVNSEDPDWVIKDIQTMVSSIKSAGANCLWVTAPDMRLYRTKLPHLNSLIQKAVGTDCQIFESQLVTSYPATGGDGVHYWFTAGSPIARNWADKVFQAISSEIVK